MSHTKEDILRIVREEDVKFVRMQFVDVFGELKNVAVMASQLEDALDNGVMIDGSSIEGFVRVNESDQFLRPDLDTFAIYPWRPSRGRVGRLLCDVYSADGTPFVGDPRGVLRRAVSRAAELGYTLNIGPECEFFLFQTDDRGRPTTETIDHVGYFDLGPLDQGEATRREICLSLEELGFTVEASHHEMAPGQHEVDFRYEEALHAADNLTTFKLAVKTIAQRNGLHATFMPKPLSDAPGSGLHINLSLHRDGKNLFCDPAGVHGLSKEAYSFIAGMMAHIDAITAIANPLVNSYKRLTPGYSAPCYVCWSESNRSALIRIPAARGEHTRLEFRSPDPACNPYLTFAVCLAAGLDGVERGLTPPAENTENVYRLSDHRRSALGIASLPANLKEAIDALRADQFILDVLGPHVSAAYLEGKTAEWDSYRRQVSQWEHDQYLIRY
ncbi:MAG: type I glutamate--ammonia ligase [Clostridiales bacterium]|nr:type I glutamate--ammonia ligase [Clostridiales bacterium]